MKHGSPLQICLAQSQEPGACGTAVAAVIDQIATASSELARIIARGSLGGHLGQAFGRNAGGDEQKALDIQAHDLFRDAFRKSPVKVFASEEAGEMEVLNPEATLCVAIDPVDGSGNIDLNMPVGSIFSILEWPAHAAVSHGNGEPFFWPAGTAQLAAGFILYGPQSIMVLTTGRGVDMYTLDPESRLFRLTRHDVRMPSTAPDEYAVNASNYRHWEEPVRAHIDEFLAGAAGPYGRDFNMRWHGALVAEAYRILARGGLYLYPGDGREGYREGRLRLIYEAFPMALLMECAGGAASNGRRRILDLKPQSLHQRVPLVFGSKSMVDRLQTLHHRPGIWPETTAPLFATRGLFRN